MKYTPCESVRGEWSVPGQLPNLCPDCGAKMPEDRGPLRSWKAERTYDPDKITGNAGDRGHPVLVGKGYRIRWDRAA